MKWRNPTAKFEPGWSRPLAFVLALALVALIVMNTVIADGWAWRFYSGLAWLVSVGLLVISNAFVAGFRLTESLRWKWDARCGGCGYNLTGNVSGVCPECGLRSEFRRAGKQDDS